MSAQHIHDMPRKLSSITPGWWNYTTIDDVLIEEAARLTPEAMAGLSRDGFNVVFCGTPSRAGKSPADITRVGKPRPALAQ